MSGDDGRGEAGRSIARPRPALDDLNRAFWTGGAEGELRIQRCDDCAAWIHPPSPRCPGCLGRALRPRAVSGRGKVYSFTVNHHPWREGVALPYVIALVELEEDRALRVATNLVDCAPEVVEIGLPVEVCFEVDAQAEADAGSEIHVPLFRPRGRPGKEG